MDHRLIVVIAMVIGCMAPGISGNGHLSFSNGTLTTITRDGCGSTKLCEEFPDGCDPAQGSCLFTSIMLVANTTDLAIELSGNSSGYIGLALTTNLSMGADIVFLCFNRNGTDTLRTAMYVRNTSGDTLTLISSPNVASILTSVNQSLRQCTFTALNFTATSLTRTSIRFIVAPLTGTVNGLAPVVPNRANVLSSGMTLDLANPASNVAMTTSSPANTTMAMMTTMSGSSSLNNPVTQANPASNVAMNMTTSSPANTTMAMMTTMSGSSSLKNPVTQAVIVLLSALTLRLV